MQYNTLSSAIYRYMDSLFLGEKFSPAELISLQKYIASWQGKQHNYRGLYGISEEEWNSPQMTYMGDKLTTKAGKTHILGELASFVMYHSLPNDKDLVSIRDKAAENIMSLLREQDICGYFCCKKCSAALWLHVSQHYTYEADKHLKKATEILKKHRDGKGRWGTFPFYDTALALYFTEIEEADDELKYAFPALEKTAIRTGNTILEKRRIALAQAILESV